MDLSGWKVVLAESGYDSSHRLAFSWMEVVRTESTAVFDAYFAFIVSGCLGLVQHWLKTGLKETPVQMARLTEKIITDQLHVLSQNPLE